MRKSIFILIGLSLLQFGYADELSDLKKYPKNLQGITEYRYYLKLGNVPI
jgi:hypothetical protein